MRAAMACRGKEPLANVSRWRNRREVLRLRVPALRAKARARDTPLRMTAPEKAQRGVALSLTALCVLNF